MVREGRLLREAFEIHPDYLQDSMVADTEINLADHGLQLTRMSRAMKLWVSLRYVGVDAFVAAIDQALDLAEYAQLYVEASDELELMSPATLGIVCFRRLSTSHDEAELEQLNSALVAALADSGEGLVSSTRLFGRYALRVCVLNHATTRDDVARILRWLETTTVDTEQRTAPQYPRTTDITAGWPGTTGPLDRRVAWTAAVCRGR